MLIVNQLCVVIQIKGSQDSVLMVKPNQYLNTIV